MDGGCLTDIGKTLLEKLLNKAIEKSRNIFCFTCIVKEFNEERDKLQAERETMRQHFQVAINKGKGIKTNAQFWEEQANKLIQENTKTNQRCFLGFCPDCIWRYKRGEDLSTKTKEIRKLMEEKFENVELDRPLPGVERYSSQYYISFESRESKHKELLDALRDDNNYITGLQGMRGTGKTTLAKEVGRELKTSKEFDHVIDTTVSFTPDIKKIQYDIAGPLGLNLGDVSESDRPKMLWSRLTNGEKILLILDDVWENLNFDDIGIPNSDNHNRCKVFVTTCNLGICNKMECGTTIRLELLNEKEAWTMFKMYANLSNISSKSILNMAAKISTECKRIPVAIATIASSLKGQNRLEEWEAALKSLQNVSMDDVDDDLDDIYKCLKSSYDCLKNEKDKGLFLLCSLFQKDEEISFEILTRLAIGSGLFGEDYGSYEEARSQVVASKNKLLDSCLLLETEIGDVKMHYLVHEVAQLISNKEIYTVDFSNKNKKSLVERDKNIKYLVCQGNIRDLIASKFDGSKLEILIVNMHMEDDITHIPISFFENIPRLRVLNLSCNSDQYYEDHHPLSLQQSMKPLSNIRSLSFEKVDLGDISVFGSLQSLETLELTHCAIDELPHEIKKLENFRLLKLENCKIRNNNPFEVIENCPSLEELYFCHSFNDFCKEITLPTLQRYRLSDVSDYDYMMKDTISRGVSLKWGYLSEATFKYVTKTTELLHLKNCHQVQCLVDTKHINSEVPSVFSKLVVLHLEEMENLEELCNGPISFISMNNLKSITLESCPKLVSVFDMSNSQNLPLLESLKISKCEQLENIVIYDRIEEMEDWGDYDNNSCCSMFPKLKVLDIHMCPQLQFILPFLSAEDFSLLEVIKINCCYKLKHIFGQHQDVKLPSLKETLIRDSPNFIDIFPESYHSIKGSYNSISKPQTKLETMSYCLNIWERAQCLSRSTFHIAFNIKVMTLENVSKIKSVLMLSVASKVLWESLTIKNCVQLEHIIVDIGDNSVGGGVVFPNLKELNVENCDKMEYIVGHIKASDHLTKKKEKASDDHQNHNEVTHIRLPALESLKLCSLPSLIGMRTESYRTTFPPSTVLELIDCYKTDIKSFGDSTTIKELGGNMEPILNLKSLVVNNNNKVKIFDLNEVNEQQMNLAVQKKQQMNLDLESMELHMTDLFVGPKNSFVPTNLARLKIVRCGNLNFVFYTSILRCLPQLIHLRIEECNKLKYIIEEDLEHKKSTITYFPKLEELVIVKCYALKCVFPISVCKKFPELKILIIREANELKEIFVSKSDQKVEFPKLKVVVFDNLPSLCQTQGIQFQGVNNRHVHNCHKLSLTSASTSNRIADICNIDDELYGELMLLFQPLKQVSKGHDTCNKNPSSEITEESAVGDETEAASGPMLTYSQENDDLGDSEETTQTSNQAMEGINKLIEEDPLLAFEKLLTGQVSISSIRILLQELKTLMDSSSDLDHLVSDQESKEKLISLFHGLNQHQGLLPFHVKEFIEKVQTFVNDSIIKYATFQQVLKKHSQLLDSKTDLVNKLWSAYSTQTRIDNEISTANARIDEPSLQIDEHTKKLEDNENQREDLKSVVNRCNVQKNKLKAECTEWVQQSKEILSALASSEVDVREAERARNLATEGFENLKSSFPTF